MHGVSTIAALVNLSHRYRHEQTHCRCSTASPLQTSIFHHVNFTVSSEVDVVKDLRFSATEKPPLGAHDPALNLLILHSKNYLIGLCSCVYANVKYEFSSK